VTAFNTGTDAAEFGVWKASENLAENFENSPFRLVEGMISVDNRGLD
jgi:hypothetical protein